MGITKVNQNIRMGLPIFRCINAALLGIKRVAAEAEQTCPTAVIKQRDKLPARRVIRNTAQVLEFLLFVLHN